MQASYDIDLDLRQAALEPEGWLEPLRQLYRRVGGFSTQLQFLRIADGRMLDHFSPEFPAEAVDAYRDYYGHISPRRELALSLGVGQVFACTDYFDAGFVSRNEFFQDFAKPYGPRYVMGSTIALRHGIAAVLGLLRSQDDPPFQFDEKEMLRSCLPALRLAAELHIEMAMLRSRIAIGSAALAAFPHPMFVLSDAGVPEFLNPAAQQLLDLGSTFCLRGNRLTTVAHGKATEFANAVLRATAPQAPGNTHLLLPLSGGRPPANVLVTPLSAGGLAGGQWSQPRAMVAVRTKDRDTRSDLGAVAQFFGFTPAETRIAELLARGLAVDAICQQLGVAASTVRWHLKSLYNKAGVSRQAEFVAALHRLCA